VKNCVNSWRTFAVGDEIKIASDDQVKSGGLELAGAEDEVRGAILRYKSLGLLPDNQLAALQGLKKLQADIRETMTRLRRDQTLRFRQAARTSFRPGIAGGIEDFAAAELPFYRDLTPEGIDQLATRAFTLIDTDALDFMSQYNLVLAGDVHRELADGIRRTVMSGIAPARASRTSSAPSATWRRTRNPSGTPAPRCSARRSTAWR
jgi:hypothetical protein